MVIIATQTQEAIINCQTDPIDHWTIFIHASFELKESMSICRQFTCSVGLSTIVWVVNIWKWPFWVCGNQKTTYAMLGPIMVSLVEKSTMSLSWRSTIGGYAQGYFYIAERRLDSLWWYSFCFPILHEDWMPSSRLLTTICYSKYAYHYM